MPSHHHSRHYESREHKEHKEHKERKPVGFWDIFLGRPVTVENTPRGKQFVAEKKHRKHRHHHGHHHGHHSHRSESSDNSSTTAVTPEPAAEATTTTAQPVPTAEASTVTEPAASSPAEASKSTESVTTTSTSDTESTADTDSTVEAGPSTTSEATGWTAAQDSLLVAMKARGNSFKQIRQVMPEKTKVQMKERLQHVGALMDIFTTTMKVDVKGKGKAVESDTDEEDSIGGKGKGKETDDETDVETDGEASIKGKGKGKADGGERSKGKGKGKGKAKKAKNQKKVRIAVPEDSTDDEDTDSSAGSAIDPDYWPTGPDDEEFALRGHLKIVEVNSDEDDPIELRGRPVVYMQPEDHLDQEEMAMLFRLTRKNDELKWIEIGSRFFDKTGKPMPPKVLKRMLRNI